MTGAALVTGAAGAIGKAIAHRLAATGWTVIGLDRAFADPDPALADSLVLDLADIHCVLRSLERLCATQAITALVNCAGIATVGPFVDSEPAGWCRMLDVNLLACFATSQAVIPGMIGRRMGSIVNIVSDSARVGAAGEAAYAASKGGLIAFSKSLAQELGRHNVRINCVSPGPVDTAMSVPNVGLRDKLVRRTPLRRLGDPDDIAAAVDFLVGDHASFITGQVLSVSGGLTMVG